MLLCVQLLALLSGLLLLNVFFTELPEFLFEHELVVLLAHKIFDLLLTTLELEHNLSIALLDSLTVVALSGATVLKGLFTPLQGRLEICVLRFVIALHARSQRSLSLFVFLNSLLNYHLLSCAEHDQLLTERLVAPAYRFHSV